MTDDLKKRQIKIAKEMIAGKHDFGAGICKDITCFSCPIKIECMGHNYEEDLRNLRKGYVRKWLEENDKQEERKIEVGDYLCFHSRHVLYRVVNFLCDANGDRLVGESLMLMIIKDRHDQQTVNFIYRDPEALNFGINNNHIEHYKPNEIQIKFEIKKER